MYPVPRGSFLFLSERRRKSWPDAFGHRHCFMKKARATLDRVLSKAGIASRTITREWIEQGRVKVNGRVIRNPDRWWEPEKVVFHFAGFRIREEKKFKFS